ncbi:universal stress family protein (plasmid) [Rhodococcus opacus]|uniref:Universal stress family protein n=1 Tax=Rhodococcus opacus TaxID=37919 RepID=A0A1B1KHE6_RHOOP|nr:universal stress protein [Rhodococcus opacus]ANS32035.1 universal stress family protein [Rhodococcus opacus]
MTAPIVVGVDEHSALSAVTWAAREAVLRGAPLTLMSVTARPGSFGVPMKLPAAFFEDIEEDAQTRLEQARSFAMTVAQGHSLAITTLHCIGSPVHELLVQSKSARMLVVGTHRYGPLERLILGSVSADVVAHAHCPVAVVRELPHVDAHRIPGPVVVGVDGTASSTPAIDLAFEEAALRHVDLVAVHAWSDIDLRKVRGSSDFEWDTVRTRESAVLSESVAGHAQDYPDVTVRPVVVMDRPAHHLRTQAETAQLLVVGRRGRGGFPGMLLGSTSRTLVHWVSCPLLVVR